MRNRPVRLQYGCFYGERTLVAPVVIGSEDPLLKFPVTDISIGSLTTRASVSAEGIDVNLTVLPGIQILVFIPPRILRQSVEITTGFPVLDIRIGRLVHQRINALFTGRVGEVIEPVEFQGILNAAQVLLHPGYLRVIYSAYDIGRDDCCQNAQNDDDDHDFYKRETTLFLPQDLAHCVTPKIIARNNLLDVALTPELIKRQYIKHGVTQR